MNLDSGARLQALLERFGGRRLLVVGDAMLDRFLWGEAPRISSRSSFRRPPERFMM